MKRSHLSACLIGVVMSVGLLVAPVGAALATTSSIGDASPSASASTSESAMPTADPSASATASADPTADESASATASESATESASATPGDDASVSVSASDPSADSSVAPSAEATESADPSATPSDDGTDAAGQTASADPSATQDADATATAQPTGDATASATAQATDGSGAPPGARRSAVEGGEVELDDTGIVGTNKQYGDQASLVSIRREGCVITFGVKVNTPGTYRIDVWDDHQNVGSPTVTGQAAGDVVTVTYTMTADVGTRAPGYDFLLMSGGEEVQYVVWDFEGSDEVMVQCAVEATIQDPGQAPAAQEDQQAPAPQADDDAAAPAGNAPAPAGARDGGVPAPRSGTGTGTAQHPSLAKTGPAAGIAGLTAVGLACAGLALRRARRGA